MSRCTVMVFAILVIFSIGAMAWEVNCPTNEVWSDCGSACPPTCDDPNPICTLQCKQRCVCLEGFVRNKCGKCIPECDCPRRE